jgi:hypothetical protein
MYNVNHRLNGSTDKHEDLTMRTITIELPDMLTINGAKDAPENLRSIPTANWDAQFCLTALTHGISQKMGDTWSVSKKDTEKLAGTYKALQEGDWNQRVTQSSASKVISSLDKFTPEELAKILEAAQAAAAKAKS